MNNLRLMIESILVLSIWMIFAAMVIVFNVLMLAVEVTHKILGRKVNLAKGMENEH